MSPKITFAKLKKVVGLEGPKDLTAEARRTYVQPDGTRTPPRPEDLMGALQDRIHPSSGRLRAARSVNRHRR